MASIVKSALRALGDKSDQPGPAAPAGTKQTAGDILHDIKEDIKDIPKAFDRGKIIGQLSSEEKIALLSGDDTWHTVPVPRLGIPRVRCSDGPNGVRGTAWTNGAAASCFPCATALGASFDVDLARRVGHALGQECRARGIHCLLGPTTNIQRHPCGGRGFESFSEDPHLSGYIALAWIEGVQSAKVMATPKHFVGNEQEYMRRSNNSVIDERTLHEIYIEPFRIQMKANPDVFMTSYNKVNGTHAAEHPYLLRQVLRGDLGFKGLLMSDWSGTYSSCEAIKAGLDLEMPGPAFMRGVCVERDIVSGKLRPEEVDECVDRVLAYVQKAQASGIPFEAVEQSEDTPQVRALLREAAESGVVLLKNDNKVLPLAPKQGMTIAVIGPNANFAAYSGGGSANLNPTYTVTPLQAIQQAAAEFGGSVKYAVGADGAKWLPLLNPFTIAPDGQIGDGPGVICDFYDQNPWGDQPVSPLFSKRNNSTYCFFIDGIPKTVPVRGYISMRMQFVPDESGVWELSVGVAGQADLYLDGRKIIDNSTTQKASVLFFGMGSEEHTAEVEVEAGKVYQLEVRFSNFKQLSATSPYTGRRGGIRVGGRKKRNAAEEIKRAIQLSAESDVTILCIGTNSDWESEGYDREDIKLPPGTDSMVSSILAANPRTIVVNQSGMPVELPWIAQAPTLLQAFFGGNECGTAIASALFGRINPSGKLPLTWPKRLEDYPSHKGFGDQYDTVYTEGIKVGYRYFDRKGAPRSEFSFGHGLSYTTFAYSDLEVESDGHFGAKASFTIANTGSLPGAETAQVYVHHTAAPVERPDVELAGFTKVHLQPGESKRVTVALDVSDLRLVFWGLADPALHKAFSYYSVAEHAWVGEKGTYEIQVGTSSTQLALSKPFSLRTTFRWVGLQPPKEFAKHTLG